MPKKVNANQHKKRLPEASLWEELPVLISVAAVSSGASYRQLIQRKVALAVTGKA